MQYLTRGVSDERQLRTVDLAVGILVLGRVQTYQRCREDLYGAESDEHISPDGDGMTGDED
jgi:hypothetical protein